MKKICTDVSDYVRKMQCYVYFNGETRLVCSKTRINENLGLEIQFRIQFIAFPLDFKIFAKSGICREQPQPL